MANSKIVITFNSDLEINQQIGFKSNGVGSTFFIDHNFVWKTTRAGFGQVTKGTPTSNPGERSAINFMQAFNLDWNFPTTGGTYYTVSRVLNVVTIQLNFPAILFSSFFSIDVAGAIPPVSNTDVTAVITNTTSGVFQIDEIEFSEADTNPCQNIKVSVTTSELATVINQPFSNPSNTDNPIIFEVPRNTIINLDFADADGQVIQESYSGPKVLNPNDFQIQINASPNGATAVFNNTNATTGDPNTLLDLEFSIDNITWQSSNFFDGFPEGNYTCYVRDQYGCSTTLDFTVTEFGLTSSFFYISKANSIRTANRIDFGDAGNYKNDENTLSCEADVPQPFKETQLFQSADVVTTQLKSNYSSNIATVIRENGDEIDIPVVKLSNYLGVKDSRDARKYDLGNGLTGIYFLTGNIYDFNTGLPTGENHYLNGSLPIWAKSGNYIKVDSAWFLIENIIYDDTKNAEVIVVSNNYNGSDVPVIAGCIFNIFDYEIYEFVIDMVDYIDEIIKVRIVASDDNFTTVTHLSEDISVKIKHEYTKNIYYWNNDNNDVFYATGIRHNIRIPYQKKSGITDENSQVHKTDTTTILKSAELYEADEFLFEPVTKEIWRKLMIALSCKNVIIDGVGYVKNGEFETEGPLDDSNLYVLTAKMLKTGNVFASQSDGTIDFNTSNAEIPGLISTGNNGYLRYN